MCCYCLSIQNKEKKGPGIDEYRIEKEERKTGKRKKEKIMIQIQMVLGC